MHCWASQLVATLTNSFGSPGRSFQRKGAKGAKAQRGGKVKVSLVLCHLSFVCHLRPMTNDDCSLQQALERLQGGVVVGFAGDFFYRFGIDDLAAGVEDDDAAC